MAGDVLEIAKSVVWLALRWVSRGFGLGSPTRVGVKNANQRDEELLAFSLG